MYIWANIWQTIGKAFRCANLRDNKLMQVRPTTITTMAITTTTMEITKTTEEKQKMKSPSVSVRQSFFLSHFLYLWAYCLLQSELYCPFAQQEQQKKNRKNWRDCVWQYDCLLYGTCSYTTFIMVYTIYIYICMFVP